MEITSEDDFMVIAKSEYAKLIKDRNAWRKHCNNARKMAKEWQEKFAHGQSLRLDDKEAHAREVEYLQCQIDSLRRGVEL